MVRNRGFAWPGPAGFNQPFVSARVSSPPTFYQLYYPPFCSVTTRHFGPERSPSPALPELEIEMVRGGERVGRSYVLDPRLNRPDRPSIHFLPANIRDSR